MVCVCVCMCVRVYHNGCILYKGRNAFGCSVVVVIVVVNSFCLLPRNFFNKFVCHPGSMICMYQAVLVLLVLVPTRELVLVVYNQSSTSRCSFLKARRQQKKKSQNAKRQKEATFSLCTTSKTINQTMDPAIKHGLLRRRSGRLAKRQRIDDKNKDALLPVAAAAAAADEEASHNNNNNNNNKSGRCCYYKPKATASGRMQDCGILPSE